MEAAADARPTEGAVGATEYARTLRVLLAPRMCPHLSLRFIRWFLDKTLKKLSRNQRNQSIQGWFWRLFAQLHFVDLATKRVVLIYEWMNGRTRETSERERETITHAIRSL